MNLFKDSIAFKQRTSEGSQADYQTGFAITAWMMYVGALTRNPVTADFYGNVVDSPIDKRIGRTYHKWLHDGYFEHVKGFDRANHFVKLPLSWLAETHHIESVDAYTDENNVEHEASSINISNKKYYNVKTHKNNSHVLVKFTDDNYEELSSLITNDYENIYCAAYYFKHINAPITKNGITTGGEFYIAPIEGGQDV